MKRLFFNILALLSLSGAAAADEPPPLNFKGIYEFQYAGLPFGRMGIEAEENAYGYRVTSDIMSEGIVRLFTRHESHTVAEQTNGDRTYDSKYQTKKKKKEVHLVYKNGKIIKETLVPTENPAKRPPVDAALKNAAYDPLRFNLALRKKLWDAMQSGASDFTLNIFDGRRLTEVDFSIAGNKAVKIGEEKFPAIKLAVRRKLLAGFTKSELEDADPNEPTLWMYVSNDERLVPLKVEVPFLFGKITGTLAKECRTGESCLLGLKE